MFAGAEGGGDTNRGGPQAGASGPWVCMRFEWESGQLRVAISVGVTVTPKVFRSAMARWISSPSPLKAT